MMRIPGGYNNSLVNQNDLTFAEDKISNNYDVYS